MIAFLLLPIYILLNYYAIKRIISFISYLNPNFNTKKIVITIVIIYILFTFMILLGYLMPYNLISQNFKLLGNYWLGILLYMIMFLFIIDIIRFIIKIKNKQIIFSKKVVIAVGIIYFLAVISFSTYGIINSKIIRVTRYTVNIDKKVENLNELNLVLVADLHLGINTNYSEIKNMVSKINHEKADVVVIAGDIFDNDYDAIDNPEKIISTLKKIKTKYGVYAVYGNHDIDEQLLAGFTLDFNVKNAVSDKRMDKFLKKANINLLRDNYILVDNKFYIYGRPDLKKLGRDIKTRKTAKSISKTMDINKPIIVLDHEPNDLVALSKNNIDITLSGHTHDGQIFPLNILMKFIYPNSYGYKKFNNMHSIVTSGIGVYGPNMRTLTIPEIAVIKVKFK